MTIAVRHAERADAAVLYRAWQALRQHYNESDRRIMLAPVSQPEFAAGLDASISRRGAATLVAVDGKRLAGFATASVAANQPDRLPERYVTIGYLWVEPQQRRAGVARQLFEAISAWARTQEGVIHFEMPVLETDAGAAEFWRSIGFTPFIKRLWAPLDPDPA